MKITEILLAEHAVFHNLFDCIEKAAPRLKSVAEIKLLGALLDAAMRPHAKTEDDLLMEPLEHSLAQIGQSETFHDEHEEIDAKLAAVQEARQFKQARTLLLQAVQRSREHFDKEERIVFPLAEELLKAKTLSDLGERWLKRREMTSAETSAIKILSVRPALLQPVH
ncbi:MAG TPA: hemerythrin domain-containing protein [Candidatus Aquilonibacter sp.]|nr:hemerythrin domain-containing protein [Candidatus Aquilonibacter sp.]